MFLSYFDEVKAELPDRPYFFIGGVTIDESAMTDIEAALNDVAHRLFNSSVLAKSNELHGKEIFQGKGCCKGMKPKPRIDALKGIIDILAKNEVHKHLTQLDVANHRAKYNKPEPEYNLGLMFYIEQIDRFLEKNNSKGMLFGDYERDEANDSIINLSHFKHYSTRYTYGRKITHLLDTLYFAHSHHSRFVQLADVFLYLVQSRHYNVRKNRFQQEILEYVDDTGVVKDATRKNWPY